MLKSTLLNPSLYRQDSRYRALLNHFDCWAAPIFHGLATRAARARWEADPGCFEAEALPRARRVLALCEGEGKRVRAGALFSPHSHRLPWDKQVDIVRQKLIFTEGKTIGWDCVHEAFNPRLRCTQWDGKDRTGSWVPRAFHLAHEAAPATPLFLSDYAIQDHRKWSHLLDCVKRWLAQGVPIHGLSIQLHSTLLSRHALPQFKARTEAIFRRATGLGLRLHCHEQVVWACLPKGNLLPPPAAQRLQALRYAWYNDLATRYGAEIAGPWFATDADWFGPQKYQAHGNPGAWTADYQPKPAAAPFEPGLSPVQSHQTLNPY